MNLLLFGLLSLGASVPQSAPQSAPAAPAIIDVTAKLIEIPSSFPPDDLYDYAYVMRYEVVGGALDKQTILVAHYKPRQPRSEIKDDQKNYVSGTLKRFKVGATHKLRLDPNLNKIWAGATIDDFFASDRKSTRYWCLCADPAE